MLISDIIESKWCLCLFYGDIYRLEVEHISQDILDDSEPSYLRENAIQNMRVIQACYESIQTGKKVELDN